MIRLCSSRSSLSRLWHAAITFWQADKESNTKLSHTLTAVQEIHPRVTMPTYGEYLNQRLYIALAGSPNCIMEMDGFHFPTPGRPITHAATGSCQCAAAFEDDRDEATSTEDHPTDDNKSRGTGTGSIRDFNAVFLNFWMFEWRRRLAPEGSLADGAAELRMVAFATQFIDIFEVAPKLRTSLRVKVLVEKTVEDIFKLKYADKPASRDQSTQ